MPEPPRRQRADARRNRARLLAAAREIFDERGVDAPLDDVARRAGVGNATMYRHFPTRREMIVAVYAEEVAALAATGRELLGHDPADDALFAWLRVFVAHVATKRDLVSSLADDPDEPRTPLADQWHATMHATAEALVDRARRAGTLRPGVDAADLITLAYGVALTGAGDDRAARLLDVVRRGTVVAD